MRLIKPVGDKVLIEPLIEKEVVVRGIIVPDKHKDASSEGVVVQLGTGSTKKGKRTEFEVKIGDRVFFSRYDGTEVKIGDRMFKMIASNEILAIIE